MAVRPRRRADLSAPVTTCGHHLPVGSLEEPLTELLTYGPGCAATPRGGRAPGRVEHWHRTCTLSDQQQGSPAGGSADHTIRVQQQPGSPGVRHVLETS